MVRGYNMSWEDVLKTEDALTEWMEEWQEAKRQLNEEYMEKYQKIRNSLFREAPKARQSSRNLRRKNPRTGRQKQPIAISNDEREERDMSDPKEARN